MNGMEINASSLGSAVLLLIALISFSAILIRFRSSLVASTEYVLPLAVTLFTFFPLNVTLISSASIPSFSMSYFLLSLFVD